MGTRVLVVESDPSIRRYLQVALSAKGCEVTTAATGGDAIDLMAGSQAFDAILIEFDVPGKNGLDVLRAASPRLPPMRRFLMSGGWIDQKTRDEAAHLGVELVLKPIPAETLTKIARSRPDPEGFGGGIREGISGP